MANNQLLDVCAAIRSDLARQAQDLAAIRADCHAAADSVAPGVAALKDAISGLAGDGEAGRWISWGLSGVGAVQADSACLMLMLWALGKGRRWILVALLVNLALSPPNGLCWAVYLLATWLGRLVDDYRQRFPWLAACCGGAAEGPGARANPPAPAAPASSAGRGWFSGLTRGWFGGEASNPPAAAPEAAMELV
jgi:hypothetical protein